MKSYNFRQSPPDRIERILNRIEDLPEKLIGGIILLFVLAQVWRAF